MLEGKAVQSMSRRGNCYDNAVIESFFAILKSECFYSRTYHSIAELQAEIEEYLVYYNQNRIKLRQRGFNLNHKTVLKLMNELGIHSILQQRHSIKNG